MAGDSKEHDTCLISQQHDSYQKEKTTFHLLFSSYSTKLESKAIITAAQTELGVTLNICLLHC